MKMDLGCRGLYSACWCRLKSTRNWIPLGLFMMCLGLPEQYVQRVAGTAKIALPLSVVLGSCTIFRMCPGLSVSLLKVAKLHLLSLDGHPAVVRLPCKRRDSTGQNRCLYYFFYMQMQTRLWSWLISAGNSEPSGTVHGHERCEALETVRRSTVGPAPAVFRRGHSHDSLAVASRCMDFRHFCRSGASAMDDLRFPAISSTTD